MIKWCKYNDERAVQLAAFVVKSMCSGVEQIWIQMSSLTPVA